MPDHRNLVAYLYQQHFGELSRFLTQHVGCGEVAADLVHELFARLLANKEATADIRHQRGYLFRCARNLATEAATSPRWSGAPPGDEAIPVEGEGIDWVCPERQASDKQTLVRLLNVVMRLPPRCREAFVLHKFDGLTYAEVAQRMGISVGQVERHMLNALATCRAATRESLPRR